MKLKVRILDLILNKSDLPDLSLSFSNVFFFWPFCHVSLLYMWVPVHVAASLFFVSTYMFQSQCHPFLQSSNFEVYRSDQILQFFTVCLRQGCLVEWWVGSYRPNLVRSLSWFCNLRMQLRGSRLRNIKYVAPN